MEAWLLLWWSLDDIYPKVGLAYSFVSNSGYDFIPIDGTNWWYVIVFIQTFILLWPIALIIIA